MKIFLSLFVIGTLLISVTTSCTKTETKTVTITDTVTNIVIDSVKPPATIVGFWGGNVQVTGSSTNLPTSFDLGPDSTLFQKGLGDDGNIHYGVGTYSLSGTAFSYTFTATNSTTVQTGTGVYNASAGTITGTWQNVGYTTNGTFSFTKEQ